MKTHGFDRSTMHVTEQDTPTKKRVREMPQDWETKTCPCCQHSPLEPTPLDIVDQDIGRRLRKWGQRLFTGSVCWWCQRMCVVKFAHLQAMQFKVHLESGEDKRCEAAFYAFCFLSLRIEGKVHVTLELLEQRAELLKQAIDVVPALLSESKKAMDAIVLMAAWCASNPDVNPVAMNYPPVQLLLDGQARLGLRVPFPLPQQGGAFRCSGIGQFAGSSTDLFTHCKAECDLLTNFAVEHAAKNAERAASLQNEVKDEQQRDDAKGGVAEPVGIGAEGASPSAEANSPAGVDDINWPKGRLGTSCKKAQSKVDAILMGLSTASWRTYVKDQSLRATIRSVAGLKVWECQSQMSRGSCGESPPHIGKLILDACQTAGVARTRGGSGGNPQASRTTVMCGLVSPPFCWQGQHVIAMAGTA
jgi:hypothetical protein